MEPLWAPFVVLLPRRHLEVHHTHPLGGHRCRDPDRVLFQHVVAALGHGSMP